MGGYEYFGKYVCSVSPYLKNSVSCVLLAAGCKPNTKEYLKYTIYCYMSRTYILHYILLQYANIVTEY